MSERSDLIVPLAELPATRDVQLGAGFVENAIGTMAVRSVLERPSGDPQIGSAHGKIELYLGSPGVFARGTLHGTMELACSRCIEPVQIQIEDDMMVSFLPTADVPTDNPTDNDPIDQAVDPSDTNDVDLFGYDGDEIDLTDLFRERLILAVPYAPLCSAECKGLCSACGNNLNTGECGCDRTPLDPRLAPLRDLVLKE